MGVANISGNILTDSGASLSSYLPLTGGTLTGALTADGAASEGSIKIERDSVAANTVIGSLAFTNNNSATTYGKVFGGRNAAGDGYVALGTGISNNLYALETGNVGIGTSSPLQTATNRTVTTINGTNDAILNLATGGTLRGYIYVDSSSYTELYSVGQLALLSNASQPMTFATNGSERMRITSDGWVRASNTGAYITGQFHEFSSNLNNATTFRIKATSSTFTDYIAFIQADKANNSDYSFLQARSSNTSDTEFNLRGDGNAYADGSWNGGGADYAEYFEWFDGNPNNEDRRGYSVSLVGNKIKIAEKGETIIGVISGNPSVIGDSAWNMWTEKYLRDDFGTYVRDENGFRILNPNYNPDIDYISREERPEWGIVGLMGKLCMRKGQEVMPNWVKMKDVSDSVEQWLIK